MGQLCIFHKGALSGSTKSIFTFKCEPFMVYKMVWRAAEPSSGSQHRGTDTFLTNRSVLCSAIKFRTTCQRISYFSTALQHMVLNFPDHYVGSTRPATNNYFLK